MDVIYTFLPKEKYKYRKDEPEVHGLTLFNVKHN